MTKEQFDQLTEVFKKDSEVEAFICITLNKTEPGFSSIGGSDAHICFLNKIISISIDELLKRSIMLKQD
jgi:hypothetical protein